MKQIQIKIVSYTPNKYKTKERNPLLSTFAIFPVWFTVDSGEWSPERGSLEWCDWCDSWYVIFWAYLWNDPKHLLRYFIIDALFSWHMYFIEQVFRIRQTVKYVYRIAIYSLVQVLWNLFTVFSNQSLFKSLRIKYASPFYLTQVLFYYLINQVITELTFGV